ncbi:MAG: hypothetical protein JXR73_15925, partial [Candidatus Omnitrophica bacterium]|nr:hypothetical protein [Candidatus Omnitrophota bacterium]
NQQQKGEIKMDSGFKSRKFIVAVVTVLSIIIASLTGVELSDAEIASIAGIVMTYLGGQSYVDVSSTKNKQ